MGCGSLRSERRRRKRGGAGSYAGSGDAGSGAFAGARIPHADVDDGLLDVFLLGDAGREGGHVRAGPEAVDEDAR